MSRYASHKLRRYRSLSESYHPRVAQNKKPILSDELSVLVGEGGFGPPKSVTTDLQSAPFSRSGIPPFYFMCDCVHEGEF